MHFIVAFPSTIVNDLLGFLSSPLKKAGLSA